MSDDVRCSCCLDRLDALPEAATPRAARRGLWAAVVGLLWALAGVWWFG